LAVAILVLIPGQSRWLLGLELVTVGVSTLIVDVIMELRTGHSARFLLGGSRPLHNTGLALLVVCGVTVVAGGQGGLFWLPAAVLVLLAGVFFGAWRLMLGIVEEEAAAEVKLAAAGDNKSTPGKGGFRYSSSPAHVCSRMRRGEIRKPVRRTTIARLQTGIRFNRLTYCDVPAVCDLSEVDGLAPRGA